MGKRKKGELTAEAEAAGKRIKLLLLDCDGVLTDGRLYFAESGEIVKVFHARDGQGLVNWHRAGFRSGIISGRKSAMVDLRGGQLGIEFIRQGRKDKEDAFREIIRDAGVTAEETAFVGDDTPDIGPMKLAGFSAAVGDAHDQVKLAALYVAKRHGGRGAVREVIDLLLSLKTA